MPSQHQVEILFRTADRASAPIAQIARATGGLERATRAVGGAGREGAQGFSVLLNSINQTRGAVSGLLGPLAGVAALVAGGLSAGAVVQVHQAFEDTSISIAGMLTALEAVPNMNVGLETSAAIMDRITIAAAQLPGEAEDYIQVFRQGLPGVTAAMANQHATLEQMADFTNMFAAVGAANNLDAGMVGRDLSTLLRDGRGGAGLDVSMWTTLAPVMRNIQTGAKLTADQFNTMTQPQRWQAINGAIERYRPQMNAAAASWSSIEGAVKSTTKAMLRLGTTPLFNEAKIQVQRMLAMFTNPNTGQWTELGETMIAGSRLAGDYLVKKLHQGLDVAGRIRDALGDGVARLNRSPLFRQLASVPMRAMGMAVQGGQRLLDGHGGSGAAMGAAGLMAIRAGGGPAAALAAGVAMNVLVDHTKEVNFALGHLGVGATQLQTGFTALWAPISAMDVMLGNFAGATLPGISIAFNEVSFRVTEAVNRVAPAFTTLFSALSPIFGALGSAFGAVAEVAGQVLGLAISEAARALTIFAEGVTFMIRDIQGWMDRNNIHPIDAAGRAGRYAVSNIGGIMATMIESVTGANSGSYNDATRAGRRAHLQSNVAGIAAMLTPGNNQARDRVTAAQRRAATGTTALDAAQATLRTARAALHTSLVAASGTHAGSGTHAPGTPGARGGNHTHNDFRNSHFSIQQRFAEGFDPDRVALAFTADLERTASRRMQSGFEPAFGLR